MVLGIARLERYEGRWMIVDSDGRNDALERELDCSTVFIEHEGRWEEVYCGEVIMWHDQIRGHDYNGPAIALKCGVNKTNQAIAVPEAKVGMWYALHWYENDIYWALEPGMRIRTPLSDEVAGTFEKAPMGKCVCTVFRGASSISAEGMGRVAMDLGAMPFPKEMWFFDGEDYQESELEIYWGFDDVQLTIKMFDEIEIRTLFWLF